MTPAKQTRDETKLAYLVSLNNDYKKMICAKIAQPQSHINIQTQNKLEYYITSIKRVNQIRVVTIVLMPVQKINQDIQYDISVIPMMRIVSLARDSFSRTILNVKLYTYGTYVSNINNGKSLANQVTKTMLLLCSFGSGWKRKDIQALESPTLFASI